MKQYLASVVIMIAALAGSFNFSYADIIESVTTNTNTGFINYTFHSGSAYTAYGGFSYRPNANHNICTVEINAKAIGSPTDALQLEVYRGNTQQTNVWGGLYSYRINEADNITGTGYEYRAADSAYQIRATSSQNYDFNFTPCMQVAGGTYYNFVFHRTPNAEINDSTNGYSISGDASNLAAWTNKGTGEFHFDFQFHTFNYRSACFSTTNCPDRSPPIAMDVVMIGSENYSNFTASSTTGYSSSTCTPPNSILDVGGGVSYALCYMFVPNAELLNQYSNLSWSTHFPFSYIGQAADLVSSLDTSDTLAPVSMTVPTIWGHTGTTTILMQSLSGIVASGTPVHDSIQRMRGYAADLMYLTFGLYVINTVMKII